MTTFKRKTAFTAAFQTFKLNTKLYTKLLLWPSFQDNDDSIKAWGTSKVNIWSSFTRIFAILCNTKHSVMLRSQKLIYLDNQTVPLTTNPRQ